MSMPANLTRTLSVVLALVLAACGGGSDDMATFAPSSLRPGIPPAASAPVPTPASAFPASSLSGYRAIYAGGFGTVSSVIANGVRHVTGIQAPITIGQGASGFGISYLGPNEWRVDDAWWGVAFGPSTLVAPSSTLFDSFRIPDYGLDVAKPGAGGLSLTHSGLMLYTEVSSDPQRMAFTFFSVGSGTPFPPPGGIGPYNGITDGYWFDGTTTRRLFGSPATVTVDATGVLTVVLELRGHDDAFAAFESAPTTVLGTASGVADNFAAAGGHTGKFSAQFFGPGAEELGIAFTLTGPGDARVFGVIAARR